VLQWVEMTPGSAGRVMILEAATSKWRLSQRDPFATLYEKVHLLQSARLDLLNAMFDTGWL
jgi:hypothetical protein